MSDTVPVVVGWDDTSDQPYVYADPTGDGADGKSGSFNTEVPRSLWGAYEAASNLATEARRRVVEATGYDPRRCRMLSCCPEWQGEETPGQDWFQVMLSASGSAEEWPVREVEIEHAGSQSEAEAMIAALPEEFLLLGGFGRGLVTVRRERLNVEHRGYGPFVSACHRCGWERDEHPL